MTVVEEEQLIHKDQLADETKPTLNMVNRSKAFSKFWNKTKLIFAALAMQSIFPDACQVLPVWV